MPDIMKNFLLFFSLLFMINYAGAQSYELTSPDGRLKASIKVESGIKTDMNCCGRTILRLGNIGLATGIINPVSDLRVLKASRRSVNETIKPQIKEKDERFINAFNELEIKFRDRHAITFRMFNEGLAYRFSTSFDDTLTIAGENLDIYLDPGDSARFQSSETFNSCWETPYEHSEISGIEKGKLCNLPFLVEKRDGPFIMITESDLYNYPGLWLTGTGTDRLSCVNPPYPESLSYEGSIFEHGRVTNSRDYIAKVKGSRTYPWRIFGVDGDEKGLISNNMVYLLASPSVIEDVSWIKPGVAIFDWWAKYNIYGVNFKAGINTETAKYFIDFCAKYGFRYFLFDDGWCPEENLLSPRPGLDIAAVTAYAEKKGVDIMLWVLWHTLQKQWNEAFSQFGKWGIKGIKIDFMNRDDQPMVEFYEAAAAKASENGMIVDFHGAYKPCGLNRKYPNVLTREALIEFEYNGWTQYDTPVHHNLLPYIRMFAGPMDYIPATLRNSTKDDFRPVSDYPMGQGTRAHAMALFVVLSSPLTMLPDSPSDYYREKECTQFLAGLPVLWDETKLLKGKIAEYTVMARRSGQNWFIGAITNWDRRTISLETDFLPQGSYRLEAIEDGINAGSRAEDYRKTEKTFQAGDVLELNLASGGGWIAKITPSM
jgi:alpha-glucosidase